MIALRCAARARSRNTATAAESSAAPAAIRAICQPGMPPATTVWMTVRAGGGGARTPAGRRDGHGKRGRRGGEREQGAGQPGHDGSETADALDGVHDDLLRLMVRSVKSHRPPARGAPAIRRSTDAQAGHVRRNVRCMGEQRGPAMSTPVRASDQDLRALAAIVSQDRPDLADREGLPESLLADLMEQIRCDVISFERYDSGRQASWGMQRVPVRRDDEQLKAFEGLDPAHFWDCHWDCRSCSYPERTGDLRSVVKIPDFYSAWQWHSTGMYCDFYRPRGFEHELQLCLPDPAGLSAGPGRTVRLYLFRGPGPDFSERDRAVLTLLRPHLYQAYLDAERGRHPVPRLTPRQNDLLHLVAAGHTNTQIARRLGISETPCAPTWKTSTKGCTSPAAPPPSPAPSQTWSHATHDRASCATPARPAESPSARTRASISLCTSASMLARLGGPGRL